MISDSEARHSSIVIDDKEDDDSFDMTPEELRMVEQGYTVNKFYGVENPNCAFKIDEILKLNEKKAEGLLAQRDSILALINKEFKKAAADFDVEEPEV